MLIQTIENKAVETAKLTMVGVEITEEIEKALYLCYKMGYIDGQYDMQNSINPILSKT